MKTLRYLLIVMGLVSVLSISAQTLAKQPEALMRSTSVMVGSGSTLPSAAITGAYVTGTTPGSYTPAESISRGPRKARKEDTNGDGWEDEDDPDKPTEPFPLGDAAVPMMLMALAWVMVRMIRRKAAQ